MEGNENQTRVKRIARTALDIATLAAVFACLALWLFRLIVFLFNTFQSPKTPPEATRTTAPCERLEMSMPNAVALISTTNSVLPEFNGCIGTGVLVKKTVAGRCRTVLVTARHVATAAFARRGTLEILLARPGGIERRALPRIPWLIDAEKHDDLAVLDVSDLDLSDRAIDLENPVGAIRPLKGDDYLSNGVIAGSKAFSWCGITQSETFVLKVGWYCGEIDGFRLFNIEALPGNSGSPVFVYENGNVYFVGIYSFALGKGGRYAGVVPLEYLFRVLDEHAASYFDPTARAARPVLDYSRSQELMRLKGIDIGNAAPAVDIWRLPGAVVADGVTYAVSTESPLSASFSLSDPKGRCVGRGSFAVMPSVADARLMAFAEVASGCRLPMDVVEKAVRCVWIDEKEGILSIGNASRIVIVLYENLIVTFAGPEEVSPELAAALVKATRRRRVIP